LIRQSFQQLNRFHAVHALHSWSCSIPASFLYLSGTF
jgi:hypothetical protein